MGIHFLLLTTIILSTFTAFVSGTNVISGPANAYVILSGPLPVHYSLDSNPRRSYLALYKQGDNTQVARQQLQQVRAGIVQFPCDAIVSPGSYIVRLYISTGDVIASTSIFVAVWAQFNLTLPNSHIAQEENHPGLRSTYRGQRVTCRTQPSAISFYFEVIFSEDNTFTETSVVHQELNVNLRKLNADTLTIRCEIFDRAGFYKAVLRESQSSSEDISSSNVMRVTWGDYYKLSSAQESVFPCHEELVIEYTRPKCVRREDNIHMFATKTGRTAAQNNLEYMYEAKATVNGLSATFNCDDIRLYQWENHAQAYCFRYQTVAANQAVTDHGLYCLPANSTIELPGDGEWSLWSSWSECSGNCNTGKQSRFRYCNNPSPTNGGRFCEGDSSVDWRQCQSSCNPVIDPKKLSTGTLPRRPSSISLSCRCGCTVTKSVGLLIPGSHCPGTVDYNVHIVWLVQAAPGAVIQLNITDFRWQLDGQMLRIRDGESYSDRLLLDLKGNQDWEPQSIISSGSYLHIEFMSNEPLQELPDLFLATYRIIVPGLSAGQEVSVTPGTGDATWKLPTIIAGSVAGCVLVLVLLGLLIYRRFRIARVPKTDPNASPNHVVLQVQGGEYTKFGDTTPSVHTLKTSRRGTHSDHVRSGPSAHRSHQGPDQLENGPISVTIQAEMQRQHKKRDRRRSEHNRQLDGIREDGGAYVMDLPDPYHVTPEDFIHASDLLHLAPVSERQPKNIATLGNAPHLATESRVNRKISVQGPSTSQKPIKQPNRKHRHRRRRQKHRQEAYRDPQEVDKLIHSLPVGEQYTTRIDPDSEYRALINHLSSTGSHNQSELVNTSAEVHQVPNTTPVEDTSQELSPVVSPQGNNNPIGNGQRSPCLDDGYNSLANTGSTQSNISTRDKEHVEMTRLNRIKEKSGDKSENSSDMSPSVHMQSLTHHSTHSCGIEAPLSHRHSTHCYEFDSQQQRDKMNDISHITCPLLKPDGESDLDTDPGNSLNTTICLPPPLDSSKSSSPRHQSAINPPPPSHFADTASTSHSREHNDDTDSTVIANGCTEGSNISKLTIGPSRLATQSKPSISEPPEMVVKHDPKHIANVSRKDRSMTSCANYVNFPPEGPKIVYINKNNVRSQSATTSDSYDYDDYLPPPV